MDADGNEDPSKPVAFVEQKRFTFKEDIRFYTDETKTAELMRIKARQRFDPRAKYDVTDAQGQKIGLIQKVFGQQPLSLDVQHLRRLRQRALHRRSERTLVVGAVPPPHRLRPLHRRLRRTGCRSPTTSTTCATAR